ncbi:MAG: hypothetical protein ACYSWR_05750, partial [Planctomycetota bacterium]
MLLVRFDYKLFDKDRAVKAKIDRAGFDFCICEFRDLAEGNLTQSAANKKKSKPENSDQNQSFEKPAKNSFGASGPDGFVGIYPIRDIRCITCNRTCAGGTPLKKIELPETKSPTESPAFISKHLVVIL